MWSGGFAKNPQLFPAVLLSDTNRAFPFKRRPFERRAIPFLKGGPLECRVILFLEGVPAKAWRFQPFSASLQAPVPVFVNIDWPC